MSSALTNPALRAAWNRFHAAQQEVLTWMEESQRYADFPQHRAKAYHTMMEALAMAYNFAVAPRLHHPRLQVNTGWQTDFYTLGQNGPDLNYALTFLDGTQTYRLTGDYGDCTLILFQLISHLSGHPDSKVIGNHDLSEFQLGPDKSFDIILSPDKHDGNWIPLDPACDRHFVLIRRFMPHPSCKPARLQLDRISPLLLDHYDAFEFDEVTMAGRIDAATDFVKYLIRDFNLNLFDFYTRVGGGFNNMAFLPGTVTSQVGSPSSNYAMAVYNLAPDEALVFTLDPLPDGIYWSYQVGDVWSRSLNFTHRMTTLNKHEGVVDSDGAFRVVLSHVDPGVANWLDTTGRLQGTVVLRNYVASYAPTPASQVVKLKDLMSVLPADTKKVTPQERAAFLEGKRRAYLQLHGE